MFRSRMRWLSKDRDEDEQRRYLELWTDISSSKGLRPQTGALGLRERRAAHSKILTPRQLALPLPHPSLAARLYLAATAYFSSSRIRCGHTGPVSLRLNSFSSRLAKETQAIDCSVTLTRPRSSGLLSALLISPCRTWSSDLPFGDLFCT